MPAGELAVRAQGSHYGGQAGGCNHHCVTRLEAIAMHLLVVVSPNARPVPCVRRGGCAASRTCSARHARTISLHWW